MDEQNKGVNERWAPADPDARDYAGESGYSSERGYAGGEAGEWPDRRTQEIRADIENTREDLRETVDAIQERLRPSNVVSRAAENVRDAAVGRVKRAASRVQRSMPSRAEVAGNPVVDRIRENPIPAALAAVSLAWLAFGRRRSADYSAYDYRDDYRGRYGRDEWSDESASEVRRGYEEEGRSRQLADAGRQAMSRAQSTAQDASRRMRRATWEARTGAQRLTRDNPLAAAGAAAALGLVIGLALPETERENRLMGEARDSMVDRAKDAARSAAGRVQEAAQQAQRVATDVITATDQPGASAKGESA